MSHNSNSFSSSVTYLVVICILNIIAVTSFERLSASSYITGNKVDVSYLYHFNQSYILHILDDGIETLKNKSDNECLNKCSIEIDASSSRLGDDGSFDLLSSMVNKTSNPFTIKRFGLRKNGISGIGMNRLLKCLLPINSSIQSERNETHSGAHIPLTKNSNLSSGHSNTTEDQELSESKSNESEKNSDENNEMYPIIEIEEVDLSFNYVGLGRDFAKTLQSLFEVVEDSQGAINCSCPLTLRLNRCGLGPTACRAINKGLIKRETSAGQGRIRELYLSGNPEIGDVGVASLTANFEQLSSFNSSIFEYLDLSSCNIGDAGASAIARKLGSSSLSMIDLSNNCISDIGCSEIGRALASRSFNEVETENSISSLKSTSINLSGNKQISDIGARELAEAIKNKCVKNISIRSCSIRADGASALGKAIKTLITCSNSSSLNGDVLQIDLSGNQLGKARRETKKSGFSAKAATESASSAFNFIGKRIKSGLKDYAGIDVEEMMGDDHSYVESDDEVEGSISDSDIQKQSTQCGIRKFVESIIGDINIEQKFTGANHSDTTSACVKIGFRQCDIDKSAVDALAALVILSKEKLGIRFLIDTSLNDEVSESLVREFNQMDTEWSDQLVESAERHFKVLKILQAARERSMEATSLSGLDFEDDYSANDIWLGESEPYEYNSNIYTDEEFYSEYDEYDRTFENFR